MVDFIVQIIIGLVLIIIGMFNLKGNVFLLHSYHRKRVKKEDIKFFGKKIGIGSIIIGFTIINAGVLSILNYVDIVLVIGFIVGFIIIFYSLFKYNKGIF